MLKLRDYQDAISTQAALLLERYNICYLAMECRTGKTLTAFAVAIKYGAKSVLMVSKVKALPNIRAAWNLEGSVKMDDVKDAVTDFFTNVFLLRKAVGRMLRGEEV